MKAINDLGIDYFTIQIWPLLNTYIIFCNSIWLILNILIKTVNIYILILSYSNQTVNQQHGSLYCPFVGVSVRRVEDITEALWGSKVSSRTISNLNKKAYEHIEEWRSLLLLRSTLTSTLMVFTLNIAGVAKSRMSLSSWPLVWTMKVIAKSLAPLKA